MRALLILGVALLIGTTIPPAAAEPGECGRGCEAASHRSDRASTSLVDPGGNPCRPTCGVVG